MALKSKELVDVPKGCVFKKNGGYTYVYYATRCYRNEKGNPTCDRSSIGKYDPASNKMIPNRNYYEVFKKEPVAFPSSIENYGTYAVFNKICNDLGLTDILNKVFGDRCDEILSTAHYILENGNAMVYLPDWQNETVSFYKKTLTSSKVSELFQSISENERKYFFNQWIQKANQKEFVAYDVTSISSYSKNIPELEWGYNRDKEDLPQINFAMYYGEESRTPLYYRIYPGSITDKMHLAYMMEETDVIKTKKIYFVMDRGFYSMENLAFLVSKGCRFLMALPNVSFVNEIIDAHRDDVVNNFECILGNGIISGKKYETTKPGFRMNVHIFYDPVKAAQDTAPFKAKIEKLENDLKEMTEMPASNSNYCKYFNITKNADGSLTYEKNMVSINTGLKRCGMFAVGDTVFKKTTEEVLNIYRHRDTVEKAFDDLKNAEGMGRTYCHSKESVEGKAFVAFIALIVRSYMLKRLKTYMEEKNYTFKKIILELNKIKLIYAPNMPNKCRLLNPVTKTQREILEDLGFNESLVTSY